MANIWLNSTVKTYTDHFGIKTNPLVLDVGSRDGRDGYELAQRIGATDYSGVVLFECNPVSIETIKQNYPQATLITEAILDVSGKTLDFMQIHGDQNYVGSSTLNTKRNDNWIKETSTIKVKTKRLDEVIEELGHQNTEIDICKIDVEGYSFEVLEGMGKYIRNTKVYHIETEIASYARNKTNVDIALYMQERGYKCTSIEGEWLPNIIDQVWVRQ